jgi:Tol biopolymer transport system component
MLSVGDKKDDAFGSMESLESMDPAFSPDGHWVAYKALRRSEAVPHVYMEPFPRTGDQHLVAKGEGNGPFWSPNGKDLYYTPAAGRLAVLRVFTRPEVLFGDSAPVPRGGLIASGQARGMRRNWDLHPDGKRLLGVLAEAISTGDTLPGQGQAGVTPVIDVVTNWFEELKQKVPRGDGTIMKVRGMN